MVDVIQPLAQYVAAEFIAPMCPTGSPAAIFAFNASLAVGERLAMADSGNAGWQNDAEISQGRTVGLKQK